MYQDVLDALNASKTARQHLNAMEKLYKSSDADPHLQALIANFGSELVRWLSDIKKLSNQKTVTTVQKQNNVAKAQAARAHQFIPSAHLPDGTVLPTVTSLIAYCQSKI
ncbi:hypothetical protein [Kosakonia cowanii]|uniref:hypothetical protein n=1 Tax=Kosakonia cowanii TaxID=208223 RepID=UPI00289BC21E|nr:hypothetical protein [Kosakonia cowanii]